MKPRPYIPLSKKIKVAARQCDEGRISFQWPPALPLKERLAVMLKAMFDGQPCHLDHDPPLYLRKYNERTGKYTPDARDPEYLVYRTAEDHRIKTNVHGEHGQYSDRALIKREKRRKRKRSKKCLPPVVRSLGRPVSRTG